MVKRLAFAVPGDLATPTGGYAYDRRMIAELGHLGWQIDVVDLGDGFPWPSEETRKAAAARLFAIPAGRIVVVDGLALGALPATAPQLAARKGELGRDGRELNAIRVTILESHVARAWYEAPLW